MFSRLVLLWIIWHDRKDALSKIQKMKYTNRIEGKHYINDSVTKTNGGDADRRDYRRITRERKELRCTYHFSLLLWDFAAGDDKYNMIKDETEAL